MKHIPHWIPIENCDIFNHKIFVKNADNGISGSCIIKSDKLGNKTFEWGYKDVIPTHYWSF